MVRALTLNLEGRTVRVHRNLNNGLWSVLIKMDGREKVVGHLPEVTLLEVTFHVQEGGRQRVIREKRKNVHAFARGIYTASRPAGIDAEPLQGISYNPYRAGHFYQESDFTPIYGASRVRLSGTKGSATIDDWYQVFISQLPHKRTSMAAMNPERYDYREVACPQCHAVAGSYCIRPSGHSGPFVEPHQPRRTTAHVVWRAEEIDKYGQQLTSWNDDPTPGPTTVVPGAPAPAASHQLFLFDAEPATQAQAA